MNPRLRPLALVSFAVSALVVLLVAGCGPGPRLASADSPVQTAPVDADLSAQDWTAHGHDPGGAQYSPLSQITLQNISELKPAWIQHSGDFKSSPKVTVGTSFEATPLFVNKTLYYCTPLNRVFALDPVTGKPRWIFDPFAKDASGHALIKDGRRLGNCRGVAYWQATAAAKPGPCSKRVFRDDPNGNLFAIDADTGRACADFGPATHPGYTNRYDYDNYGTGFASSTSAPAIIGDLVVVGGGASDGRQDANDGMIWAFDVHTGELKWRFDPIPEAYRHLTGAANAWAGVTVDPKNKLVFVPTTSPSTDYYGGGRKFDMPLTDAVVALHADTGTVAWSYQIIRHDLWDYDLPTSPVLVTIRKDGKLRDVAIEASKTGYVYVLDRLTGQPVFPVKEQAVEASPLPEDVAAPTQPIPVLPEPFARNSLKRSDMYGIAVFDKLWCQNAFDHMRYKGLFTAPGTDEYLEMPSTLGGGNWGGVAFDPATNSIILKSSNIATHLHFVHKDPKAPAQNNVDFMTRPLDGPYGIVGDWFLSPIGIPCTPPPYGQLTSISMDTGKIRWTVPLGRSHRYGLTMPGFMNWGSPTIGGPIVTGSGLVFFGGTMDSRVRAFEARTGREVWSAPLPAPGMATPMTYAVNGRQYVLIAAGGSAVMGTDKQSDAVVAYALPQTAKP
jgi:quinoprotein glucose dehydrogenase